MGAELMHGGSLADAFRERCIITLRRALEISLDCARGLAYMHSNKNGVIIHRDLKPGNLMIAGSKYMPRYASHPAQLLFLRHTLSSEWIVGGASRRCLWKWWGMGGNDGVWFLGRALSYDE